jgi:hypothetical protein
MQDIGAMTDLFMKAYVGEKKHVPGLPKSDRIRPMVEPRMKHMLRNHQGLVAVENGIIKGYLTYILGDQLFGKSECAFVPLIGHAVTGHDKNKTIIRQRLLNEAGRRWVEAHKLSWVVTSFEHDPSLERFWFKNGFGQRCADAILMPEDRRHGHPGISTLKADAQTIDRIADLHRSHVRHYPTSPIFMPGDEDDPWPGFKADADHEDTHVWIALSDDSPAGYIRIEPEACAEKVSQRHCWTKSSVSSSGILPTGALVSIMRRSIPRAVGFGSVISRRTRKLSHAELMNTSSSHD